MVLISWLKKMRALASLSVIPMASPHGFRTEASVLLQKDEKHPSPGVMGSRRRWLLQSVCTSCTLHRASSRPRVLCQGTMAMSEDTPGCHNRDGGNATDTRDAANILHGTGQTPTTETDPAPNVHNSEWRKPALHTHTSAATLIRPVSWLLLSELHTR